MKKAVCILIAIAMIASLVCVFASAAEVPASSGAYEISTKSKVNLTFYPAVGSTPIEASTVKLDKDGADITDFYADAERFTVTAVGKAYAQYLLLVCSSADAPCEENTVYINQTAADSTGKIEFSGDTMAYPKSMNEGTYFVYVIGETLDYSGTESAAASFKTYTTYTLGDVNSDGQIDSDDALLVLKHSVRLTTLDSDAQLAADVNLDGEVDSDDALLILKYSVHIISKF